MQGAARATTLVSLGLARARVLCDREDQQRLQKFVDQVAGGGNGAGVTKEAKAAAKAAGAGEFEISYAASSRSVCKGCLKFILKGDVRFSPRRCPCCDPPTREVPRVGTGLPAV